MIVVIPIKGEWVHYLIGMTTSTIITNNYCHAVEQIQGPMAQLTVVQFANSDPNMIENLHWSIDWSEFSLTKLPTATSHVVLRERNDLQSSVNFQVLASDFRMLDVLVRDASQEISNCCNFGDANLQSHVQGITSEVSGLISKSGLTGSWQLGQRKFTPIYAPMKVFDHVWVAIGKLYNSELCHWTLDLFNCMAIIICYYSWSSHAY